MIEKIFFTLLCICILEDTLCFYIYICDICMEENRREYTNDLLFRNARLFDSRDRIRISQIKQKQNNHFLHKHALSLSHTHAYLYTLTTHRSRTEELHTSEDIRTVRSLTKSISQRHPAVVSYAITSRSVPRVLRVETVVVPLPESPLFDPSSTRSLARTRER